MGGGGGGQEETGWGKQNTELGERTKKNEYAGVGMEESRKGLVLKRDIWEGMKSSIAPPTAIGGS